MSDKLYPRCYHPWDLEPHYSRHVSAMTTENLHHKADIAEQLAWRDKRIAELEAPFQQTHGVHWSWVAKEAEQRKRIEDLETELSAYKAVAKERWERLQVTADWVDQNLSDMQVYELKQALELPQRPQDGDKEER